MKFNKEQNVHKAVKNNFCFYCKVKFTDDPFHFIDLCRNIFQASFRNV